MNQDEQTDNSFINIDRNDGGNSNVTFTVNRDEWGHIISIDIELVGFIRRMPAKS